jgi:hypothetical protein
MSALRNPAFFPTVVILAVFLSLVVRQAWSALGKAARVATDRITLWRLSRICGSRARAYRLIRAVERETLHGVRSVVPSSLQAPAGVLGRPVGRSAPQGVPRDRIGSSFPKLTFAQRQAE